jgi:chromosome segregation ATPase
VKSRRITANRAAAWLAWAIAVAPTVTLAQGSVTDAALEKECQDEKAKLKAAIAALEACITDLNAKIAAKAAEVEKKKKAKEAATAEYSKALEAWQGMQPSSAKDKARATVLEKAKATLAADNAYLKAKAELEALEAEKKKKTEELEAKKAALEQLEKDCPPPKTQDVQPIDQEGIQ